MSNTFYIDANVRNSINVNSKNNRFTYKLPQTLELPTGTEIGLQSSIINLKGITGASIEIGEDIEETICFQYYGVDTNYPTPTASAMFANTDNVAYNLNIETTSRHNAGAEFVGETFQPTDNLEQNDSGYSEVIMPLAGEVNWTDGTKTLVPMCGKAKIKIAAGVYSINKLALLITNQINLKKLPTDLTQDFYDYQKENQQFYGYLQNSQTTRNFIAESASRWNKVFAGDAAELAALTRLSDTQIGALDFTDTRVGQPKGGICSVVAVTGNTNDILKGNAQAGGFGAGNVTAGCSFAEVCVGTSGLKKYFIGWEKRNIYVNDPSTPSTRNIGFSPETLDIFKNGIAFGTTGFNIAYDTQMSAYTMNYLHQPRKIPTSDRFGTSLDNAGQECVYVKSPVSNAAAMSDNVLDSINAVMGSISGIMVYNWALETAQREGDNKGNFGYQNNALTLEQKLRCESYRQFGSFFTTYDAAAAAWEGTIWARMGFQYNDIQADKHNGGGGTQRVFQYGNSVNLVGFTTSQAVDISIIPTISTIFNPVAIAKLPAGATDPPTPDPNNLIRGALPAVSDSQFFNLMGQNIPEFTYSNNTAGGGNFCVAPFKASFYTGAVMIPVLTKGKPLAASRLPTLSENGYLLITSNLVEGNDILKNQQTDGLLDLIPKSSLSNQDYMADRNILTHTLSNPKSINELNIKILNPDMTDVTLEKNSTILIRITLPVPKPTNFIANESLNIKSEQVGSVIGNMVASHTDPNVAQTNTRIDISNIHGEQNTGGTGIDDDELAAAQQAIIQQAIDEALQNIPPALPQGGLNPDAEDEPAEDETLRLQEVGAALAVVQETGNVGQQQREQQSVAPKMTQGEEPQPESSGAERREGQVYRSNKLTIDQRQAAQARLEQLKSARAKEQGREVALGRSPRKQVEIRQNIQHINAEIEGQLKILQRFGGRPDPDMERQIAQERANPPRPPAAAKRAERRRAAASDADPAAAPAERVRADYGTASALLTPDAETEL